MNALDKKRMKMEPCILCGEMEFIKKYRIKRPVRQVVECSKCGLLQVNPREDLFQTVDFEPPEERQAKREEVFNHCQEMMGQLFKCMMEREEAPKLTHYRRRLNTIQQFVKKGRLLDVGCGHGIFLKAAGKTEFDLYGVEPCHKASRLAQQKSRGIITCATLEEAAFPKHHFDVVTIINTIEHMSSPQKVLSEVNRILKHGGILLVETPNSGHWLAKLFGKRWVHFLVPDHIVFFSRETLGKMLNNTGFSIVDIMSGEKSLSIRFILYQISRYQKGLAGVLMKISEFFGLATRIVKFPQPDEMIVLAQKTREIGVCSYDKNYSRR